MNTDHLSPADRDLLAKAKAAINVSDRNVAPWWEFNCASQPAAIIALITRLGEAQAIVAQAQAFRQWFNKDGSPCDGFRFRAEGNKLEEMLAAQAPAAEGRGG